MLRRGGHPLRRAALAVTIVVAAVLTAIGCPPHDTDGSTATTAASAAAGLTPSHANGAHPAHHLADIPGDDCCRRTPRATAILAHPTPVPARRAAPAELAPAHPGRPARAAALIPDPPSRQPGALLPNAMVARR